MFLDDRVGRPHLVLDALRRSLPVAAEVLRRRAVVTVRSTSARRQRSPLKRVSSFHAAIAMYQSRYFTEKRWWMPTYL